MAGETVPEKPPAGKSASVESLRPDTSGHNLVVKIVDAKPALERPGKAGSRPQKIVECTVGDETGMIIMTARNEQVDVLKPGSYVTIRNAKIEMYRSTMRLAVDQFGKLEPAAEASFEPKTDLNMSLVEYELVQVPADVAWPVAPAPPAAQQTHAATAPPPAAEDEEEPKADDEEAAPATLEDQTDAGEPAVDMEQGQEPAAEEAEVQEPPEPVQDAAAEDIES